MNTLILLLATAGVYTAQLDQLYNDDLVVTNVDMASKQDKLIAGENITISSDNVISATGGGGGGGGINTNGVRSLIDASFVGGTNAVNITIGEYLPRITDSDGNKTAVTIGSRNGTVGKASLANGNSVEASGTYSHAEGFFTKAQGQTAHAEGVMTKATNNYAHAEGNGTTAGGLGSHAEGLATTASGNFAFAAGYGASATGQTSFVWQGMGATTVIDESTIANLTNAENRVANGYTDHGAGTFNINPAGGADGFYIGGANLTTLISQGGVINDVKTNGISIVANKVADIYNPVLAIASSTSVTNKGALAYTSDNYVKKVNGIANNLRVVGPLSFDNTHYITILSTTADDPNNNSLCSVSDSDAGFSFLTMNGKISQLLPDNSSVLTKNVADSNYLSTTGGTVNGWLNTSYFRVGGESLGIDMYYDGLQIHGVEGYETRTVRMPLQSGRLALVVDVTNKVNEVKSQFWDEPMQINWTMKMVNGEMKLYATTNVNMSTL